MVSTCALTIHLSWSSCRLDLTAEEEAIADGFAPDDYGARGNRLFVTCGIGFSVVPIRINAPPQVAFCEVNGGDRAVLEGRASGR